MLERDRLAEEVFSNRLALRASHRLTTQDLNLLVDAEANLLVSDHLALGAGYGFGGFSTARGRLAGYQAQRSDE